MTVSEIAQKLGVNPVTVYGIRRSFYRPSPKLAAAIEKLSGGQVPADLWKPAKNQSNQPSSPLSEWMTEAGISVAGLARKLGVSISTVYGVRSGRNRPGPKLASAIERITDGHVSADLWRTDITGTKSPSQPSKRRQPESSRTAPVRTAQRVGSKRTSAHPLIKWMTTAGISGVQLARELEIHPVTVSNIRRGVHRPGAELARAIEELSGGQVPAKLWRHKRA